MKPNTFKVVCPDGEERIFRHRSVPKPGSGSPLRGVLQYKGKSVVGTVVDGVFIPKPGGRNSAVFSPKTQYVTRKGFVKTSATYVADVSELKADQPGEILTLWDVQKSEGELKLSEDQLTKVIRSLHTYASEIGEDFNVKRARKRLLQLHTLKQLPELSCVQVSPTLAIVGENWPDNIRLVLSLVG